MGKPAVPAFPDAGQAVQAMVCAAEFLADADWVSQPAAGKAACLVGAEQASAVLAVARTGMIGAFDAAGDFELDGYGSIAQWLIHMTRIDKAEAAAHRAWVRRRHEHPVLFGAMRDNLLSPSWAKAVMRQTSRIPEERRQEAD